MKWLLMPILVLCITSCANTRSDNHDADMGAVDGNAHEGSYESMMDEIENYRSAQFDNYRRVDQSVVDDILSKHYELDTDLSTLDKKNLIELYQAVESAAFYSYLSDHARLLALLSTEIEARDVKRNGIAKTVRDGNHLDATHNSLIAARLFDDAEEFSRRFPVEPFPWSVNAPDDGVERKPKLLSLEKDDATNTLTVRPINIGEGRRLVSVVHPNCGFSRSAMNYLLSIDLEDLVEGEPLWVVPQVRTSRITPIQQWNETHEAMPLAFAYRESEWPEFISFQSTPVFYVLEDGELVDRIVGWPGDDQFHRLREALLVDQ